jgi:hypothetical protein
MTDHLATAPRRLQYGIKPKPLLAKSLRKLESARKRLREIAALWGDIDGTVEFAVEMEALPALDELEQALREAVEYLNEPPGT